MKQLEQFRAKRQEIYRGLFGAQALCIAGLFTMPAMLFAPPPVRVGQFLFFWFLAWLCGKKNRPLVTLSVIFFIVAFNLVLPNGRLLFSVGTFAVTDGALWMGLHRALTLTGLIMLSRVTIRHDLKIPGLFGELVGESLRLFSIITSRKHRISRKNLIADIDRMMLELSSDSGEPSVAAPASRTKPAGFAILIAMVLLAWLFWIITPLVIQRIIVPLWFYSSA
ncbi:MAG: hypothetical protein FWB99_06590 [Treponema sp.]|nr:hypothetical protein [Treponema sp.]